MSCSSWNLWTQTCFNFEIIHWLLLSHESCHISAKIKWWWNEWYLVLFCLTHFLNLDENWVLFLEIFWSSLISSTESKHWEPIMYGKSNGKTHLLVFFRLTPYLLAGWPQTIFFHCALSLSLAQHPLISYHTHPHNVLPHPPASSPARTSPVARWPEVSMWLGREE